MLSKKQITIITAVGVPTFYALVVRFAFGVSRWQEFLAVMSVTFLFLLPFIVGILTIFLSNDQKIQSGAYRVFAPWVPVFIFLIVTLLFAWEGWACWMMILPVFLICASIGGLIGGVLIRNRKNRNIQVSLFVLLPFFCSPIEQQIPTIPGAYKAYTYIDINAPADKIWANVTRVREIPAEKDKGWLTQFLDFPRPVKAELNFEGCGATREAIFTKGLVFHETVSEYTDKGKMTFSIKAYPHEIPSTSMDEHIVIGGDYFDVLDGTYEMEKLGHNKYRLHLYSHFKLNTRFNFYASWWAKWIMEDIQNNILQVEKERAEAI
ncbi:hypothetical protein [Dyadobacter bucti]|uniref:hypothetical protein n=1 Tax=Dyadobacter bucti TaxID=2572203 RepID=UPI003F6F31C8